MGGSPEPPADTGSGTSSPWHRPHLAQAGFVFRRPLQTFLSQQRGGCLFSPQTLGTCCGLVPLLRWGVRAKPHVSCSLLGGREACSPPTPRQQLGLLSFGLNLVLTCMDLVDFSGKWIFRVLRLSIKNAWWEEVRRSRGLLSSMSDGLFERNSTGVSSLDLCPASSLPRFRHFLCPSPEGFFFFFFLNLA